MTPLELNTYARQKYNIVSDTFWSDDEIYSMIRDACFQMARDAFLIEATYTSSSVIGTQSYSKPALSIALKRVTYDGRKLERINMREDDMLTGKLQTNTSQGQSMYYYDFGSSIYLRPIPSAVVSIAFFSYDMPDVVTASSTLAVPAQFHPDIADYLMSNFHAKEKNFAGAKYYMDLWATKLQKMKMWSRKNKRTDQLSNVQDIDSLSATFVGND